MPVNKVWESFDKAVEDVFDGAVVLIGGFGGYGGMPSYLIRALARRGAKNLTIVHNGMGLGRELIEIGRRVRPNIPDYDDVGILVEKGLVKKGVASFPVPMGISLSTPFAQLYREGKIELELVPQGTLAERIRAAKAGIGGFYTPVGPGTVVEKGKELRVINGKKYVLEYPLKGDFALIRAYKADRLGNLVYRGTARTFNATMAGAADVTIVEVDEVVEVGELYPDEIVTPMIYVDRIVVRPPEGRVRAVQKIRREDQVA